jgi:mono/diheme cytochrome c family protein
MRLTRTLLVLGALLALLIYPVAPALAQDVPTPAPPAAVSAEEILPPTPLNGQGSFAQNCAPCHGPTGQGDGPSAPGLNVPPTALGDRAAMANRTPQEWFSITKNGAMARMMPPWGGRLNDQEIWDTVAYAWSLGTSQDEVDQGKAVWEANCASCHGTDGKPTQQGVPDLSDFARTSAASNAAWDQVVSQGKGAMPAFDGKLSEAEQQASVTYARTLSLAGPLFRAPLTEGTGVISGTVTNQTTGQAAGGLSVELGIFDQTSQLETRNATTDAQGKYEFTGLPTDSTLAFAVRTTYPENVPYSSDFVSFEGDKTAIDLPVLVYETTNDPAGIRAERVHYIVEFDAGAALVAELIVFSLDGDRAYVGDGNHVLRFPLPPGAQQLAVNEGELGERFVQIENGFVDRLALPPGQNVRQILFRYALPYDGTTLDFQRSLPYPATAVNALISDAGQQVTSEDFVNGGKRDTESGSYYNLSAQDLPANQPVRISMTDLPDAASAVASGMMGTGVQTAPTGAGAAGGLNRWVLIGLIAAVAAVAAFLVALPLTRSRRGEAVASPGAAMSRDELVDALAQLDLAYEAGEIGETAYRDQRLRLKAQLRDAMRKEAQA